MKRTRITIGTEPNSYLEMEKSLPGLLYGEIVTVLDEFRKFEQGKKGTRFDTWLGKTKGDA